MSEYTDGMIEYGGLSVATLKHRLTQGLSDGRKRAIRALLKVREKEAGVVAAARKRIRAEHKKAGKPPPKFDVESGMKRMKEKRFCLNSFMKGCK